MIGQDKPNPVLWFTAQAGKIYWVIDYAWGQDGWILAKCFFVCVDGLRLVKKKKEQGRHQAILTEQAWSVKDL